MIICKNISANQISGPRKRRTTTHLHAHKERHNYRPIDFMHSTFFLFLQSENPSFFPVLNGPDFFLQYFTRKAFIPQPQMQPLPRPLIYFLLYFALTALKLVTYSFTVPRCHCPHVVIRLFIENYYVLTLAAYFPHAAYNVRSFLENLTSQFFTGLQAYYCNEPRSTGKKCVCVCV